MKCPYCSWTGSPEAYGKHYEDAGHGVEGELSLLKVHEKINLLMNEINLGFTPSSMAEQQQMSDVVEKLMEAADIARRGYLD